MVKTVTIELPDSVVQKLGDVQHLSASSRAVESSLQTLIKNTLDLLSELTQRLQGQDETLRAEAASKLGDLKLEAAIPALSQALSDNSNLVKDAAEHALKTIGTQEALSALDQAKDAQLNTTSDFDSLAALVGTLDLGTTDLGENHDKYIAEALEQELRSSD